MDSIINLCGSDLEKADQGDVIIFDGIKKHSDTGFIRDLENIDSINVKIVDEIEYSCLEGVFTVEDGRDIRNLEDVNNNQIILFNDLKIWLDNIISWARDCISP